MPTGNRIRANNVYGIISDNPLTAAAITFNSVSLPLLPQVVSAHAVVVFDPKRVYGEPEIVVVTLHTAASTVATILRGQYGTSARSHPQGTAWAHVPVDEDWTEILTSSTRPTDPYRGQEIFEYDTNRFVSRSTADVWQQDGLFFDPPACRVYHNANQSFTDATLNGVAFNSERYDTNTMHDTVTNNNRITINTAGLYLVTFDGHFAAASDYTEVYGFIRVNNTSYIAQGGPGAATGGGLNVGFNVATVYKFAANDYVTADAVQNNTANAARNLVASGNYSPEFSATWIGRGN